MTLPCRIHRLRNRKRVDSLLALALVLTICLLAPVSKVTSQDAVAAASEGAGLGWLPAVPIQITAGVDMGYDDNVDTSSNGQGSAFARENLVLTYARPGERTQLSLIGVGSFTQFFDLGTDDKNGNVTLSLVHNFSTRLSFYASIYAAYATEPDFQSDVGPENQRADHFDTNDIFSVTYALLPRLAAITTYTFRRIKYADASIGNGQDRVENTIGEELDFGLTRRTKLVGNYRYEWINYDTAPTNSTTHYLLVGIEHNLTQHLVVHVRGGPSFRSLEGDGNTTSPYVESSVDYTRSNHSLNWTTSYGFEAANAADVSLRKTFRTGLNLTYNLTSRLSSTTAVYYHHDENQDSASSGTNSAGSQDTLDLLLGLRYTINKRLSVHVDYNYTMQSSLGSAPGYSRNRYSAGLSYAY
jgi:hypothetical protein